MDEADGLLAKFAGGIAAPAQGIFKESVRLRTLSMKLPKGGLYNYYNTFVSFKQELRALKENVLSAIQVLLSTAVSVESPGRDPVDVRGLDERRRSESIIDATDSLLESVDIYLDGLRGGSSPVAKQASPRNLNVLMSNRRIRVIYCSNVPRPQDMWRDDVDNSNRPFIPRQIRATLDYDTSFPPLGRARPTQVIADDGEYAHMYEDALKNLTYDEVMFRVRPRRKRCLSIDEVPLVWVSTVAELAELASQLNTVDEFGVDLEMHDYRSFQGFTCTIQISTWRSDYIVDTLLLRKSVGDYLGPVFANPRIVKVFHAASNDVQCLQRDFSIYVVNMFDTQVACLVLKKPYNGLDQLLRNYCGVVTDKRFQMADWRIRPLPKEMLDYARNDARYLLYVYELLLGEALALEGGRKKALAILNQSRDICLLKYKKEIFSEKSYLKLYSKYKIILEPRQLSVFASLYKWRDRMAREYDESLRYVLPNHMVFLISKYLPKDPCQFKAICSYLPPLLKINLNEVIYLIKKAEKDIPPYMLVSHKDAHQPTHDGGKAMPGPQDDPPTDGDAADAEPPRSPKPRHSRGHASHREERGGAPTPLKNGTAVCHSKKKKIREKKKRL